MGRETIYTDDPIADIPAHLRIHYDAIAKNFSFVLLQHILLEINVSTKYMKLTSHDVGCELFRRYTSSIQVGPSDDIYTLVALNAAGSTDYTHPVVMVHELT